MRSYACLDRYADWIGKALDAEPKGLILEDLMRVTGLSRTSAQKGVQLLKKRDGCFMRRGNGGCSRWWSLKHEAGYLAYCREAARMKNSVRAAYAKDRRDGISRGEVDIEDTIKQSWVAAEKAERIEKRGPASVWELAA